MPKLSYQKMMELLAFILHCPVCANKYTAEQTSVIDSPENEKLGDSPMVVHTDCERCKSSVVFSVSLDGPEIFSVGMVTDLTLKDVKKFNEGQSISPDEVIEFHDFLKDFDGNFAKVLK